MCEYTWPSTVQPGLSGYAWPTRLMLKPALFITIAFRATVGALSDSTLACNVGKTIYVGFGCLQGRMLFLEQHTQASTSCSIHIYTVTARAQTKVPHRSFPLLESIVWISMDVHYDLKEGLWRHLHLRNTARFYCTSLCWACVQSLVLSSQYYKQGIWKSNTITLSLT